MYTYSFEKLDVWKLAKELVVKIYKITSQFPSEEKFGLVSQLRRSAISIFSNLTEGAGRGTAKDQGKFSNKLTAAYWVLNQLLISYDLKWINEEDLNGLRSDIEIISSKINSLRKSTLTKQ